MLRVLAVDDEAPALEELLYLLREDPRVARAEGAADANAALRRIGAALEQGEDGEGGLDVVFLDINMPGLSGLDTARLLAGFARPPLIVFVTAHENFAVQAFDLKAVDYVLKPVRRERLSEAVRRVNGLAEARAAERGERERRPEGADPSAPGARDPRPPSGETVPVELGGVTRFVAVEQVHYAEAQGDYARLHTAEGSHLVRIPLSALEERWSQWGFLRIHRRYLVALGAVQELHSEGGALSVRVGGALLSVSRRHARDLRELLVNRPGEGDRARG
ncbi:LytR/AlgR family response regulator transcription factor [Streptacidiphilus sp. EB129]|uniref:LytR/AlgR family response regulator transcription factor n=1 Tax=Streptacidiphilus sp. EB129 TaxID=3156262 RepID=UPI0035153336